MFFLHCLGMHDAEAEFYRYVAAARDNNAHAFENNWPYIMQATRNGLRIVRQKGSIAYVTKRQENEPRSDSVVVHSLGSCRKELVAMIARDEACKGIRTIIKNVDRGDVPAWRAQGFKETTRPWSSYSFRDDNTFPQYVNRASCVAHMEYGRWLRRLFRRMAAHRPIVTEPYSNMNERSARALLAQFAHYLGTKGVDDAREIVRAHVFFFDTRLTSLIRLQHSEYGHCIGWSCLTVVGNITFYNAVVCNNETDLLKYLLHCSMAWVIEHYPHVRFFAYQGSENAGQDWVKIRLGVHEVIHKTHLEYVGKY